MPHRKFQVEMLTPEGAVFSGEVEMLSTRTTLGQIAILAGHEPLLATLEPTELRLYQSDQEILHFAQSEGYLQVRPDHTLMLVEEAVEPGQLDLDYLRERLQDAEQRLEGAEHGSERERLALAARKRWQTFIGLAEATSQH
jgi:F-type H+-transporting ATPase subunit epsilon